MEYFHEQKEKKDIICQHLDDMEYILYNEI